MLKGQFTLKIPKRHIFPFTCSTIYPSGLFWYKLPTFGDICYRDVCLLSDIMEPDGTRIVVLKVPKTYIWKNQQQFLFPEIMTRVMSVWLSVVSSFM